ncbi:MAG: hypothetical protein IPN62_19340 [Flavobacteriales bacterium]|nr:hypothetical protein [Flavobacteriales bacterium]
MRTEREEAARVPHFVGLLQRGAGLITIRKEKPGIRLENDVLVTSGAPDDLFKEVPVDAEAVEELMRTVRKEALA